MAHENISEELRAMWRNARHAAAESGVVDCKQIQDLIQLTHAELLSCHPRLVEVVWHLIKLDIEGDRLTPADAAFLFLVTVEVQEMEEAALRNSSIFRIRRPKADQK
jgi:hypothetical protein